MAVSKSIRTVRASDACIGCKQSLFTAISLPGPDQRSVAKDLVEAFRDIASAVERSIMLNRRMFTRGAIVLAVASPLMMAGQPAAVVVEPGQQAGTPGHTVHAGHGS
ncbi:MAG TPA: hypothetical protein DGT23_21505 [Micromonosporaceae bacterium]|nr:hypothetical protein [Micromonosporaceae bacterium]